MSGKLECLYTKTFCTFSEINILTISIKLKTYKVAHLPYEERSSMLNVCVIIFCHAFTRTIHKTLASLFHRVIPENIHTIPRMAFRNSEGKGGGLFELEIRRHEGILTIGIPKTWGGGFRSGISTGDRQECIP